MKKIFILIGMASLGLGLVGCGDTTGEQTKTPPVFTEIVVENSAPFDGTDYNTYFMEKENFVEVEVHLLNPYTYTITSIVINDYNYRFSKFESGSDFEKIIINVPVGSSLGDIEYVVEEIVYQDGDVSKTIDVTSDNIFQVYVFKENPIVALEAYNLDKESLTLDFLITDTDVVLAPYSLVVNLINGGETLETRQLSVGTQTVSFEGLYADNIYEVIVTADYDLEDGNGLVNDDLLYSGLYSTLSNQIPTARIESLTKTANSVTFDLIYNDADSVTETEGLFVRLFKDDIQVREQQVDVTTDDMSFLVLETSADYTIKVVSSYDLDDSEGIVEEVLQTVDFTTLARIIPTPQIVDLEIKQDEITFGVFIDDPNELIDKDTLVAYVYVEDEFGVPQVVQFAEVNHLDFVLEVYDVYSNFTFDLEIRGDFDLNDGLETQEDQSIFYETYTTEATIIPSININQVNVEQGYITANFIVTDTDNTILDSVVTAKLFENGVQVDSKNVSVLDTEVVFNYLAYYNDYYEIVFEVDYNLRNGFGTIENYILDNYFLVGLNVKAPTAQIINIIEYQDSIMFDVLMMDSDSTLVGSASAQLYKDGVAVPGAVLSLPDALNEDKTFTDLSSDSLYTIEVTGTYNLDNNDGDIPTTFVEANVTTLPKEAPTAYIMSSIISSTTLEFDINVVDNDGTINFSNSFVNVKDEFGTVVLSEALIIGENTYEFNTGVESETEYLVEVTAEYNLNVGENIEEVLDNVYQTTYPKELPSGYIVSNTVTQDTFNATITLVDDFSTIVGDHIYAELYINGVPQGITDEIFVGVDNDVNFTGLYSNQEYDIVVKVEYDLNTGRGTEPEPITIDVKTFTTIEKEVPSVLVSNVVSTFSEITFNAFLTDNDSVIDGSAEAVMYLNGVEEYRLSLVLGANEMTFDTDMFADTDYTFRLITNYDADDGEGSLPKELATFAARTDAKFAPVVSIDTAVTSQTSLTFDVSGYDTYTVIDGVVTAYLYEDGNAVALASQPVGLALDTYTFAGLLSNKDYTIVLKASWNLDDNVNVVTDGELDSIVLTTDPKVIPYSLITNETMTEEQIIFSFDYNDVDGVMVGSNLIANLYYGTTTISTPIVNSTVSFDISSLLANALFTVEITGDYDLGDGLLTQTDQVIYSKEYTTEANEAPVVGSLSVGKVGFITAGIVINDPDNTYVDGSMEAVLYEDGLVLQTIDITTGTNNIQFDHMATKLSTYEIRITGSYNLRDGNGIVADQKIYETQFVVFNNQLPLATISNEVVSQDGITFDVIAYDPDGVLETDTLKAVLYKDGSPAGQDHDLVLGLPGNVGLPFTGLDSNSDYVIYVMASYNLETGNGIEESNIDMSLFTTLSKVIPTATLDNITSDFDSILFDIDLTDTDVVIEGQAVAQLYDGVTLKETINLTTGVNNVEFGTVTPLVSNKTYSVKVSTSYNLDDGNGQIDDYVFMTFSLATDPKVAPIVTVADVSVTHDSILFDATLLDQDTVLDSVVTASLEFEGASIATQIITDGTASYSFTGLFANQEYEIIITASYNLDDGVTVVTDGELVTFIQTTDAYELPFITASNVDEAENTITFDWDYEDNDNLIVQTSHVLELSDESGIIATFPVYNKTLSITLYDLLADSEYTVKIYADYNLHDQAGAVNGVIFEETFHTGVNYLPTFTFGDLIVTQDTVTLNYTLQDSSDVLINLDEVADPVIEFVLYNSLGVELDRQTSGLGIGIDVVFDAAIRYDEMYEIRVETDYNLGDGTGNFLNTSIYELVIGPQTKKLAEATLANEVIGTTDYTTDISVLDIDLSIDEATLYGNVYDNTDTLIVSVLLTNNDANLATVFAGLTTGTDYTLEIVTHYDLDNGDGDILTVPALATVSFTTN